MKVINLSLLRLNDSHNYYGGAIGNIAYNLLTELARLDDINILSFTGGTDLNSEPPDSLEFISVESFDEVETRLSEIEVTDDTVFTHLYFHEPEYSPLASAIGDNRQPFVIGMCEPPHLRLRDEVSGIQKLPLVRAIGKNLLYIPRFKRTLHTCDLLVTVNDYGRDYYSEYIPETRIKTAPYGVDHDYFDFKPIPKNQNLLIVSRLIKRRGIDTLIEALPNVADAHSDVTVDIVGEGPRRSALERKADSLGVQSRLTFHGNVSPDDLVTRYRDCYAFCHLSMADGWNQPALEAMATGRPVVTVDAPHNSMVSEGETGFRIPFGDSDALADRLEMLLSNRGLAERMGKESRRRVESTYDWHRIATDYANLFREVL